MVAKTVTDVILGEAVHGTREQRYADMVAIASVIQNRATLANMTPQAIVSVKSEFNAYGKSLPKGADAYRDLAERAWNQVQTFGPVHNATYYATSSAKGGLPKGLTPVTKTTGHEFFADPKGRSFRTSEGFVTPSRGTHAAMMSGNLVAPQNPYAGLVPPTQVTTVALPEIGPIPTARPSVITQAPVGRGLAALAPRQQDLHNAIQSLHPAYRERATDYIVSAQRQGIPADIASAYRSNKEQAALYAQGRTTPGSIVTKAKPGSSLHNYGLAFDTVPADLRTQPNWAPEDARWGQIGDLARSKGLTWGGDFKSIKDMPHVQAPVGLKGLRNAPVDAFGYPQLSPQQELAVRGSFVPTPTSRPTGALPGAPVGPVERASLPDLATPAMGARAASELQGYVAPQSRSAVPGASPAMGARAASELQGVVPGTPAPPSVLAAAPVSPGAMKTSVPSMPTPVPSALGSIMAPPGTMSRPSMNTAVPAHQVTTSAVPLSSIGTFPAAPQSPGRKAAGEIARGALTGLVTGGLPGAIIGGLLGPAKAQISRNVAHNRQNPANRISPFNNLFGSYRGLGFPSFGGFGGFFSGIPSPNYGAPQYDIGSGYSAIGSAFGAPAGATAYSSSNPNVSFTSLGNGYVSRSNAEYGTTYTMGPGDYDPGTSSGKK